MTVRFAGARVLVTGASRGLGLEFTRALVDRGAATVYAGARDPATVTTAGVTPVRLDITDPAQVAAAVQRCSDVDVLINNAGVMTPAPLLSSPDTAAARSDMETNYFGTLAMCRAFAPVLRDNGGGALVNVLSVVSWFANPFNSSYLRLQIRRLGADQLGPHGTARSGDAGDRCVRQLHRHRHGRGHRPAQDQPAERRGSDAGRHRGGRRGSPHRRPHPRHQGRGCRMTSPPSTPPSKPTGGPAGPSQAQLIGNREQVATQRYGHGLAGGLHSAHTVR